MIVTKKGLYSLTGSVGDGAKASEKILRENFLKSQGTKANIVATCGGNIPSPSGSNYHHHFQKKKLYSAKVLLSRK